MTLCLKLRFDRLILLGLVTMLSACVPSAAQRTQPNPPTSMVVPTTAAPTAMAPTALPATATALPPTPTVAASPTVVPAAIPTAAATATTAATAVPAALAAPAVFQIDPAQSEARFTINESLFGDPKSVVGLTSDISGVITVTTGSPAGAQIGVIQINARDLHTDEEMRDRAIRTFILESTQDDYQFITFEPTAIEGLPAQAKASEAVAFKVTGNLKIRTIIKPVVFEVSVTPKGDNELSGTAHATITRTAFELAIPRVPGVADVTDEIVLDLTFVAKKV